MRKIDVAKIKDTVRDLCLKANFDLRADVISALKKALKNEINTRAKNILRSIIENAEIAKANKIPICQDTGMVNVFLDIGQGVSFEGGDINEAVNAGVKEAYSKGYLRKSVVSDPILRKNTNTNTPAIICAEIVKGDKVKITVSPKGFGSENKSRIKMFKPTADMGEIKKFVKEVVISAGPDACPPFVIGIGIGGTFEKCAYLAKKALIRDIGSKSHKKHIKVLEKELLKELNLIKLGPMGLGGRTSVLGVNIETYPTHIAGLPVAVSVSCHATRGASTIL